MEVGIGFGEGGGEGGDWEGCGLEFARGLDGLRGRGGCHCRGKLIHAEVVRSCGRWRELW